MAYDAVIFDNDGVLTTMHDHSVSTEGTRAALRDLGYDLSAEEVEVLLNSIGRTEDAIEAFRASCLEHDIDPESFWRTREEYVADAIRETVIAGEKRMHDDVEAIFDLDLEFAIVSNIQQRALDHIIDHFSWNDEFSTYYGREPTFEGFIHQKPEPYYVEKAIDDLDAQNALFVGDSSNDVDAARNVGIDSAFIRRPRKVDLELESDPTYEIDSLEELSAIV